MGEPITNPEALCNPCRRGDHEDCFGKWYHLTSGITFQCSCSDCRVAEADPLAGERGPNYHPATLRDHWSEAPDAD